MDGVALLARIEANCKCCGDCWEWQGGTTEANGAGHPKISWRIGGKATTTTARRLVWSLANGGAVPGGLQVTPKCENSLC